MGRRKQHASGSTTGSLTRMRGLWTWLFGLAAALFIVLGVSVFGNPLCDGDCQNDPAAHLFGGGFAFFGVLLGVVAWGLRPPRR
jgi:hypothetical protein